jgi:hypothetical protein
MHWWRMLPAAMTRAGILLAAATALLSSPSRAADIMASPPTARAVTVYRSPSSPGFRLDLDRLAGFALVTETRTVSLPAGENQLRFPGVADGIESQSAILTGLPAGVLEKNRDARVLSPAALVAATLGKDVILVRTNRKTGRVTRTRGQLRADNEGVVFESSAGIEALRCSGEPETFELSSTADLAPTPTLSVRVRSPRALSAQVTLSYLAHGFDWQATYSATLSADGRTLYLGAWMTLANSNGLSFPESRVAVVAGRLNRVSGEVEPVDAGEPILAGCWPTDTTSDFPGVQLVLASDPYYERPITFFHAAAMAMPPPAPPPPHVEEEQLGDLKLYRVPERTSVNSRQMKQVRLLDRDSVPVELLHIVNLTAGQEAELASDRVLRTRNDREHHLGIPLPSGRVSTSAPEGDTSLVLAEGPLRDIAVNEDFEIPAGEAPDVQVRAVNERTLAPGSVQQIPLLPGVLELRTAVQAQVSRIEITNARRTALTFEARLSLPGDTQLTRSSVTPFLRDGRQVMRVTVPAGSAVAFRYQTVRQVSRPVRSR